MPDAPTDPPRKKIVLDLDWLPEPAPGPHTVTFLPGGRQAIVEHGQSVFEAGKSIGEDIPTECGGKGTCGRCRVRVHGEVRPPTYVEKAFIPREDLARNVRLSCRLRVERDLTVTVLRPAPRQRK
ncbi:MAG TPA: 2Fe-2S iron-sulfur cluster-binding protein [Chloroflexota bacterium]|jgi:ferredoxin|nr:2Fe-2S iron-sulfur cluster-binding protein [Chloroflexota bacterium]